MTRAPRSASWRVQNGAAIACSSVTTVMPSRGRAAVSAGVSAPVFIVTTTCRPRLVVVQSAFAPPILDTDSEGAWQAEDMLGDVREDQVRRNRRHLIEPRL